MNLASGAGAPEQHTASDPLAWLGDVAADRRSAGLRRTLAPRPVHPDLLDLASNDYLGLARDPRVTEAAARAAQVWGAGSTGSRLVTGSTELHTELERALCELTGASAGLVFSSGYLANLGAVVALSGPGSLIVSDAHNHASLVDACRLSRAEVVVVPHVDPDAVRAALSARAQRRALVVTDAVFSVDGELAPLAELADTCRSYGAALLVDEAHAVGVVGDGGSGAAAAAGLAGAGDVVLTATLSKALGSQGGAVLGSQAVIDHLVDAARTFIFDTGLAPASAGAALQSLTILAAEPDLASRARAVTRQLTSSALQSGLVTGESAGAVLGVRIGTPDEAVAAAARAAIAGVRVGCFRPPSVPDGVSRLRLTGRADLSETELALVEQALLAVANVGQSSNV